MSPQDIMSRFDQGFLNDFDKNFIISICNRIDKGKALTEKQEKVFQKIQKKVEDLEGSGIWVPNDSEKRKIEILLGVAKSYSEFYLNNYRPGFKFVISELVELQMRIILKMKTFNSEKKLIEAGESMMKGKLALLENPKFKVGDLCFVRGFDGPGLVLEEPHIDEMGRVYQTVDFGYKKSKVNVADLRKRS